MLARMHLIIVRTVALRTRLQDVIWSSEQTLPLRLQEL